MGNFISCFTEEDKETLIQIGYKYLKEEDVGGKKTYIFFFDNNIKFNFNAMQVCFSNKMNF
jgi:hypothetical protein